ncbi:Phosphoglycerate mutase-like protein [Mycena venus]|uniref:Phosphoglycerate mutase-like protein n=1 Tax=Mycena venus TaxID=2733690 RepID=A0A8H7DCX4_9AGAR|nr:Phosphoglycerate mutase-like protein [Mycena venus]
MLYISETAGTATTIISGIKKFQRVQNYTGLRQDFLKTFTYSLGVADLVPFGAHQSFQAGELAFQRYTDLISVEIYYLCVHRAALVWVIAQRIGRRLLRRKLSHLKSVVIGDIVRKCGQPFSSCISTNPSAKGNDTLDDNMCLNAGDSDAQTDAWLAAFAPNITARLNRLAPGANVTDTETYSLLSMCSLHTAASFEYLTKERFTTYPSVFPSAQVRRVPRPSTDQHDVRLQSHGLPPGPHPRPRTWVASRLMPFSARMVVERLRCAKATAKGAAQFMRVLVIDAVQPLDFYASGHEEGRGRGISELCAFVGSQRYARSREKGKQCFT